jgi:type IV pilus assembly protein PilX
MLLNKTKCFSTVRQQGLAMVMSLVILLILTLLGITAMNTSNLQLLMTGNSQYQMTALNIAEDIIHTAEDTVLDIVGGAAKPASGYYDISGGAAEVNLTDFKWADADVIVQGTSKYIIEYAGDTVLDAASLAWRQDEGIFGDTVSVFRLTSRSPSSRGAMRYVQSIFVTINSPL